MKNIWYCLLAIWVLVKKMIFGAASGRRSGPSRYFIQTGVAVICAFTNIADTNAADDIPGPAKLAGFNELLMNEDFSELNASVSWYRGLWYEAVPNPAQVYLKGGVLTIKSPASLATISHDLRKGTLFHHGYFEASLRWPFDPDNWAAFWLFSYQHAVGIDENHWCELDIFESYEANVFVGTAHDWIDFKTTKNWNSRQPLVFDVTQWNKYGLLWTPGKLTWYLNDKEVMSSFVPPICEQQDLFLILSAQSHSGKPSRRLDVNYVRVYGNSDAKPKQPVQ